jgi:hypothetical protein
MGNCRGKGSQKLARQNTLVNAIYNFVTDNPGVNAAAISGHLYADLKMKNAGLTVRKIGFFIPRYCDNIRVEEQNEGRSYFPVTKKESLENIIDV